MKKNPIKHLNIHNKLTEEEVNKLKDLYSYYHKLAICYKWKYKRLKKIKLALNMSSIALTVIGSALVPVTHLRGSPPKNLPLKFRDITEFPEIFYVKQVTYMMNKNCDSF